MSEEILPLQRHRTIEKAKSIQSLLGKLFEKQNKKNY